MTNIIPAEASLATLAASINRCIREAESAARTAVELAIEAGQQLNSAKDQVPHGQWESWLSENVKAVPRTAQAYMRLAREVPLLSAEEAQRVADLPLREAMKAIATPPTEPPRASLPTVRVRSLDDRDRIKKAFDSAAKGIRKVARAADMGATLRQREIDSARRALEQALAQLAELERDHLDVDRLEARP
ncbi:DUF3102 domain-containing protein [Azorhizophilus paspali]|uniref:DUF3102 domain-containing protein n=1 Tax=Azorhizophilus paspali TaxID=69963 RepID=A0ABV6ST60_AZOPA